jgi:hypothetical protein
MPFLSQVAQDACAHWRLYARNRHLARGLPENAGLHVWRLFDFSDIKRRAPYSPLVAKMVLPLGGWG